MAARERCQIRRQLISARHQGAIDEHGNDTNVAGERRRRFDPHEIARIVQPPCAGGIRDEPVLADDHDQDFAGADRALERIDEIDTGLDAFDVHEDAIRAEVGGQPIVEPAGVAGGVVTSIADKDALHDAPDRLRRVTRPGTSQLANVPNLAKFGLNRVEVPAQ